MYRTGNERTGNRMISLPVKVVSADRGDNGSSECRWLCADSNSGRRITDCGCVHYCDNRNGANGEQAVSVKRGTFVWDNDGTIKDTDVLRKCYIKDATTVSITEAVPVWQESF